MDQTRAKRSEESSSLRNEVRGKWTGSPKKEIRKRTRLAINIEIPEQSGRKSLNCKRKGVIGRIKK